MTTIKLWYMVKGDFVKELFVVDDIDLKKRLDITRYVEDSNHNGIKCVKWVFVRLGDTMDYEFSHIEEGN